MDICYDGRQVGSPNILRFIQDTQPLFGCSGHIHESPYQRVGKWAARVGSTLWFQPCQERQNLHYVSLEITDDLSRPRLRSQRSRRCCDLSCRHCRLRSESL
jgi:Icc-related predicted phosphoesterase